MSLQNAPSVIAPVFSPRSAELLADRYEGSSLLYVVAISVATYDKLGKLQMADAIICDTPDADAMAHAVEALAKKLCRVEGYQASQ